jgi:NAD-dependent dihydropyrimidine dehydrogenase PreA subunit
VLKDTITSELDKRFRSLIGDGAYTKNKKKERKMKLREVLEALSTLVHQFAIDQECLFSLLCRAVDSNIRNYLKQQHEGGSSVRSIWHQIQIRIRDSTSPAKAQAMLAKLNTHPWGMSINDVFTTAQDAHFSISSEITTQDKAHLPTMIRGTILNMFRIFLPHHVYMNITQEDKKAHMENDLLGMDSLNMLETVAISLLGDDFTFTTLPGIVTSPGVPIEERTRKRPKYEGQGGHDNLQIMEAEVQAAHYQEDNQHKFVQEVQQQQNRQQFGQQISYGQQQEPARVPWNAGAGIQNPRGQNQGGHQNQGQQRQGQNPGQRDYDQRGQRSQGRGRGGSHLRTATQARRHQGAQMGGDNRYQNQGKDARGPQVPRERYMDIVSMHPNSCLKCGSDQHYGATCTLYKYGGIHPDPCSTCGWYHKSPCSAGPTAIEVFRLHRRAGKSSRSHHKRR